MTFQDYVNDHISAILNSQSTLSPKINQAIDLVTEAFNNSKKILICGNGGSAADSQHMAAEFISGIDHTIKRKGLPAIALTTDSSAITARANDYGYEDIFARQVEALGQENDILIAITTSGKSKNIIEAIRKAKSQGLKVITFTGLNGIQGIEVDVDLKVLSKNTQHIQEGHILIYHYICLSVEKFIKKEFLI
jgi:D-sedoheptulose 7-phosphate isomerase